MRKSSNRKRKLTLCASEFPSLTVWTNVSLTLTSSISVAASWLHDCVLSNPDEDCCICIVIVDDEWSVWFATQNEDGCWVLEEWRGSLPKLCQWIQIWRRWDPLSSRAFFLYPPLLWSFVFDFFSIPWFCFCVLRVVRVVVNCGSDSVIKSWGKMKLERIVGWFFQVRRMIRKAVDWEGFGERMRRWMRVWMKMEISRVWLEEWLEVATKTKMKIENSLKKHSAVRYALL